MILLQTAVIAHRGASIAHQENTIAAFAAAGPLGADWVELDVRRTADGALAVHHDAHLEDGRAIVEVRAADLPSHVPSLAEALRACEPLGVNVEIKNNPPDPDFDPAVSIAGPVVALAEGCSQPIIVSSFHPPTLDRVLEVGPAVRTGQLTFDLGDPAGTIERAVAAGHVALHPFNRTVTPAVVERAHGAGLLVNVWTVDDPDRIRELAAMGVDGIVTNAPDVAARVLRG